MSLVLAIDAIYISGLVYFVTGLKYVLQWPSTAGLKKTKALIPTSLVDYIVRYTPCYWHKKRSKKFDFTTMVPQVELFLFVFWTKLKTPNLLQILFSVA